MAAWWSRWLTPASPSRPRWRWRRKVAAQPPISVAMTKLTVNRLAHALDDLAGHMDLDQFALASLTDDHKEGSRPFPRAAPAALQGAADPAKRFSGAIMRQPCSSAEARPPAPL